MTDARVQELNRYADAARRLEGWELDFEPEPLVAGPPWDYEARARELCAGARYVLDLGAKNRRAPPCGGSLLPL